MTRQKRRQVTCDADRSHARATAAVRDRKRLVQIQMADVGADRGRARQPDLRVHVGAVHVNLTAVLVDDVADLADVVLEDAVRRRIRDHQARQTARDALPPSPADRRRPRCRLPCCATTTTRMPAMAALAGLVPCAEAGISTTLRPRLSAIVVIRANHHQPGELALRARVRLQRDLREAGDLAERRLELAEHVRVALGLLFRRERMHAAERLPRDRQHLGRRVQLHRARPERNHRACRARGPFARGCGCNASSPSRNGAC